LNTKLGNNLFSSTQGIADKLAIDWERVKNYHANQLPELEVIQIFFHFNIYENISDQKS
jgi:hypothetical protein